MKSRSHSDEHRSRNLWTSQDKGGTGKVTLPQLTGTSSWLWIAALVVVLLVSIGLVFRMPSGRSTRTSEDRFGKRSPA